MHGNKKVVEGKSIESNIDSKLITALPRGALSGDRITKSMALNANYLAEILWSFEEINFPSIKCFFYLLEKSSPCRTMGDCRFNTIFMTLLVTFFLRCASLITLFFIVQYSALHVARENKIENINFLPPHAPPKRSQRYGPANLCLVQSYIVLAASRRDFQLNKNNIL